MREPLAARHKSGDDVAAGLLLEPSHVSDTRVCVCASTDGELTAQPAAYPESGRSNWTERRRETRVLLDERRLWSQRQMSRVARISVIPFGKGRGKRPE